MAATPRPILVVGSVALDDVRTPEERVPEVLGGAASYFSLAASLFAPVRMVAVVGRDFPDEHLDLFRGRSIDLDGLQVRPGKTFRWRAQYTGIRLEHRETIETQLNVFADFHPKLPDAYLDSPLVFLANIQPALQLEVLDQVKEAAFIACDTMNLWIETDRPGLERLYRRVDCVLMNAEEAVQFSGEAFLPAAARCVLAYGPRAVIIKQGEHGSILFTAGRAFVAPAMPLDRVRDPTGAGDAFAGGLLGHLAGADPGKDSALRHAMLYGNVLGSLAVEDFSVRRIAGADHDDIERRLATLIDMITLGDGRLEAE
ncbi:MAG TPA: PfkB family carbohydrate kinase [Candidatus Limnocylindrales bacterium]|nr:PfkB family carbohydrate kinase [Candidatus Limnocylindrales bacterium]